MLLVILHIDTELGSQLEIKVKLLARPNIDDIIRLHGTHYPCNPLKVIGVQHTVIDEEFTTLHVFVERIIEGYHDDPDALDATQTKSSGSPQTEGA